MKTNQNHLVIIVSFLFQIHAFSQEVKIIPIDFQKLENEYKYHVNNKQKFRIQLENINRNLYKIEGVKVETNYNVAVPSALTGIKPPSFLYLAPPYGYKARAPGVITETASSVYDDIKTRFETITKNSQKIYDAKLLYNDLSHLAKNCKESSSEIRQHVKQKYQSFCETTTEVDRRFLENYINDLIQKSNTALEELGPLIDKYEQMSPTEILDKNKSNIKEKNKLIRSINTEKFTREESEIIKTSIAEYNTEINALPINQKQLQNLIAKMREDHINAKNSINEMKKYESEDKIYALGYLFELLANPATYQFTSDIITAKTDEIKYTITVQPNEINVCGINDKKTIEIVVKVDNGFKIDFSTGVFLNSGNDEFLGNTYYYVYTDAEHRKIVTADRGTRLLMSVGALMHFYWRLPKEVKIGGSIGVSTTASVSDLLFHVGPSVFIGNKNRVVISAGLTLKSSPILDQKLKTNTIYTKLESPDAIPTVSVFPKAGFFLSFTYNFTAVPSK